jgi:hypothetical protein
VEAYCIPMPTEESLQQLQLFNNIAADNST